MLPLKMHDDTTTEQNDSIMYHLERVVVSHMALSISQQNCYILSKFKNGTYPALKKKYSMMLCFVSLTRSQHMGRLKTLCLDSPGSNLNF